MDLLSQVAEATQARNEDQAIEAFRLLFEGQRWRVQAVARALGVKAQSVYRWRNGKAFPRPENIDALREMIQHPDRVGAHSASRQRPVIYPMTLEDISDEVAPGNKVRYWLFSNITFLDEAEPEIYKETDRLFENEDVTIFYCFPKGSHAETSYRRKIYHRFKNLFMGRKVHACVAGFRVQWEDAPIICDGIYIRIVEHFLDEHNSSITGQIALPGDVVGSSGPASGTVKKGSVSSGPRSGAATKDEATISDPVWIRVDRLATQWYNDYCRKLLQFWDDSSPVEERDWDGILEYTPQYQADRTRAKKD